MTTIAILGSTGFVGRSLVAFLLAQRHTVRAFVRNPTQSPFHAHPCLEVHALTSNVASLASAVSGCDAVINLAGANIAEGRWTEARKKVLWESRVNTTQTLVQAIGLASPRPQTLLNASAVGFYGIRNDAVDESCGAGDDFLARLCAAWENAAMQATAYQARVVCMRLGVVIGREGGILAKLLPVFKLGLGGPIGDGHQPMPWISLAMLLEAISFLLNTPTIHGPVNLVSQHRLTHGEFVRAFASALHRPCVMGVPAWTVRMMLGEASTMMLQGTPVMPYVLSKTSFLTTHDTQHIRDVLAR